MGKRYRKLNVKRFIIAITVLVLLIALIIFIITSLIKLIIGLINKEKNINKDTQIDNPQIVEEIYPPIDPFENVEKIEYTGPIEHVFFHPLVAYPNLAFDGDYQSKGMDDYMATDTEFKRFIQELYNNNYVLIDVNEFYETITDENGDTKFARKKVLFPINKKPVILSIDDMNYYEYMRENGCVHKLVLGKDGNIATYSIDLNNNEVISYDNDIVPILDNFVKLNPDFSFNGAKGIIGLTGFNGILGYRTDSDSENKDQEIETVKPIIERLKKTGWTFASHSYAHFGFENASYNKIKTDTDKWKAEVESLIGPTQVLLYPFGSWEPMKSEQHQYLVDSGFKIFCGVGIRQYEKIYKDFVFMDRKNIDGITLRNRKESVKHMFNTDTVIDLEAREINKKGE